MMSACGSSSPGPDPGLSLAGTVSPSKTRRWVLGDDAREQRQVMVDLGAPPHDGCLGDRGQPLGHRLQFGPASLGRGDQVTVELALHVLSAAVFDGAGPLVGQAPAVAPPVPPLVDRSLARPVFGFASVSENCPNAAKAHRHGHDGAPRQDRGTPTRTATCRGTRNLTGSRTSPGGAGLR